MNDTDVVSQVRVFAEESIKLQIPFEWKNKFLGIYLQYQIKILPFEFHLKASLNLLIFTVTVYKRDSVLVRLYLVYMTSENVDQVHLKVFSLDNRMQMLESINHRIAQYIGLKQKVSLVIYQVAKMHNFCSARSEKNKIEIVLCLQLRVGNAVIHKNEL